MRIISWWHGRTWWSGRSQSQFENYSLDILTVIHPILEYLNRHVTHVAAFRRRCMSLSTNDNFIKFKLIRHFVLKYTTQLFRYTSRSRTSLIFRGIHIEILLCLSRRDSTPTCLLCLWKALKLTNWDFNLKGWASLLHFRQQAWARAPLPLNRRVSM